jgi:hypothetical protein
MGVEDRGRIAEGGGDLALPASSRRRGKHLSKVTWRATSPRHSVQRDDGEARGASEGCCGYQDLNLHALRHCHMKVTRPPQNPSKLRGSRNPVPF